MTKEQYKQKVQTLKKWAHAYYVEANSVATELAVAYFAFAYIFWKTEKRSGSK